MNNLTLIQDSNWLLMRTLFLFEKGFRVNSPAHVKEATTEQFIETLSRSVSKILNQFPEIDNIVFVSDGGSWRNKLPIPKQLQVTGTTYKGHRDKNEELDWTTIYKAFNKFIHNAHNIGVTTSTHSMIEGDDWVWYWSRRLNSEGISTMIWTSDCDLKQLVQIKGNAFTCWYNDRVGLVLPEECKCPDDPMEYFMNPPFQNHVLDSIVHRAKKVNYINPSFIVLDKVLCGDSGDNIKPVARFRKNNRTYRGSAKDYQGLIEHFNLAVANAKEVTDFITSHQSDIAKYIVALKKFVPYNISPTDVTEMINYNIKLVWLNEAVLPDTVTTAMVQMEYNEFNVNELRGNYKLLLETDNQLVDLFNEAIGDESGFNDEGLPF